MSKHTAGPWKLRFLDHMEGEFGREIWINTADSHEYNIAEIMGSSTKGEQEANARLVAAAPELLEAVQRVVKASAFMGEIDCPQEILRELQAAIAKATLEVTK